MLIQCDASQLEWRTAVELSLDPVGIQELNDPSIDTHSLNEKELRLPSRLIAKRFLFRTIFRGSGYAFAIDPDFVHVSSDPRYWDERNERFYKKYAGLDRKHKEWARLVLAHQPLRAFTGREWWILADKKDRNGTRKIPWTTLSNYPVQGTGADIMAMARLSLYNRIRDFPGALLVATVHDSLVVDCPDHMVDSIGKIMYEVFRDLPQNIKTIYKRELSVPFPCEVKYGPNLLDMQELTNPL